ncbi:dihydrodipicolinate synthase family protein [Paenibacillus cremeus]|uniref:Dihydrodipicolinate synthase family protein n=1 Tax=Paenibacillus cremeus TaxID=2163881 RepID=A0A559K4M2_9BACL|nr:dihydrodipicolinate synthase family protein [Paenibacillus cremeus]TVY07066.1 dihydrodipicolinate synthase family protein [Paenibacillus cremeus]
MFTELKQKLKGINAINVTPFTEQQEIDWDALRLNVEFLVEQQIEAVYPCGNTGEFYALMIEEAKAVTTYVTEVVAKRSLVIAGVGYDAKTACELAKHAEAAGADGLMVHQPVHPYLMQNGLVNYYKQIAASTKLPLILYVRSEQITEAVLREVAALPNVVGVKYAVNHLPSFTKAVRAVKEPIVWICGTAEVWAPYFFAAGAEGFTSGLVNVDTRRSFEMLGYLKVGNFKEALDVWEDVYAFEELRAKHNNGNNVSVVKEAMYQLGLLPTNTVRPPIGTLTESEKQEVSAMLRRWGLTQ